MIRPLQGHTILIVEDKFLIATNVAKSVEEAGARVLMANTLSRALELVETDGISAAIIDHALRNEDSSSVRDRLRERGIPFVSYSGTSPQTSSDTHVSKPASGDTLVVALTSVISTST